jgi:DNA-binding response OmpR family regulator
MDGVDAFREIRSLDQDVPVLLMSGYNEQDAVMRFAGKGLAGFVQKPFTVNVLRERLLSVLR